MLQIVYSDSCCKFSQPSPRFFLGLITIHCSQTCVNSGLDFDNGHNITCMWNVFSSWHSVAACGGHKGAYLTVTSPFSVLKLNFVEFLKIYLSCNKSILCKMCTRCVMFIRNVFKCCVFLITFSMLNFIQQLVPDVVRMYAWSLGLVPDFCCGWTKDGPSICNKIHKIF